MMWKVLALALLLILSLTLCFHGPVWAQKERRASVEEVSITDASQEDDADEFKVPHGKRERRVLRLNRWAALLKGDMRRIYKTYGYPSSRYREEVMGQVVEKWTYLAEGKQFTFRGTRLIKERTFLPTSK